LGGLATATYTAPAAVGSGSDIIKAQVGSATKTVTVQVVGALTVTVTATPSTITSGGTSSIQATVKQGASNVADGTTVSFSLSDSTMGTIDATGSTVSGKATATFVADAAKFGSVDVTATASGISGSATVTVNKPNPASIQFVSATPSAIGISGSGKTTTSTIVFSVTDANGNAVANGEPVNFTLQGPSGGRTVANGGEFIGADDGSPTTASASTVQATVNNAQQAQATVTLTSGSIPGNAIIVATLANFTSISSATPVISIGGGVPSATHMSFVSDVLNLPGLGVGNGIVGRTATLSFFAADRFGNANVLQGTTVSFKTESGATVSNSANLDSSGSTTVTFRTQAPDPQDVAATTGAGSETTLISRMSTDYGITTTKHPRDGRATIVATIAGEESFNDKNANGKFDTGESFTDTPDEPFIDYNDSGARDDGTGADPFEPFTDRNNDGVYNGVNAKWDSSKDIMNELKLTISGEPFYIKTKSAGTIPFALKSTNLSQTFTIMVADVNLNTISPGSTITASENCTNATLSGSTSFTVGDGLSSGPTEINVTLSDADSTATPQESCQITITVTWENTTTTTSITGTVN